MPGYELIGDEEKLALMELVESGSNFFCGKKVKEFQEEFKNFFGCKYAQAVTSCTAALKTSIEALELPTGSEIITSAFTFVATAEAIIESGHTPVFCEIDNTYNIDPEKIKELITPRTKAIIPVAMYGAPCDMDKIKEIAEEFDLKIVEDAAQGLGSKYKGWWNGTMGDLGCFSFDAGKTLGTGDGGMILTNNQDYWRRCYEYFDHGHMNNPDFPRGKDTRRKHGFNFRMTELHAVVGLEQLKKVNQVLKAQENNYLRVKNSIGGNYYGFRSFVPGAEHTFEALVFSLPTKEDAEVLYRNLKINGVVTKNLPDAYDWHFAGTWNHMGVPNGSFPYTRDLLERSIAIMIFVKMSDEQINKIVRVLKEFKGGM